MSFAGATPDLPAEGSGADYSDIGANQRTAAATLPFMDSENQTISDAFLSGTRGVKDWLDYRQAAIGAETQREFNIDPAIDPGNAPIDPKEYQKQFGNLGLTFTPDMGHDQAVLLVNHRLDELRREYVLDNSPNGYGAQTARGLTGFAVSAVDPLNVAAAFVPGLGETRAGLLAARFGQTAARIAEGATAGATGMAALQPINYAEAQAYQDHYGPMDAFMNVAFGTVLGGGLHAGAGFLSDALSRAAPETREAALRAAVGQAVEGRNIDVEPVLATDPAMYDRIGTYDEPAGAPDQFPVINRESLSLASQSASLTNDLKSIDTQLSGLGPGDASAADSLNRLSAIESQRSAPDLDPDVARALNQRRDQILTDTNPETLQEAAAPIEQRRALTTQRANTQAMLDAVTKRQRQIEAEQVIIPKAQALIARAKQRSLDFGRGLEPSAVDMAPETSARVASDVQAKLGDDPATELQDATERLKGYAAQGAIPEPDMAKYSEANAADKDALDTHTEAAKAVARCLFLHP